jgi:ABC-2 type transport system permease protein
MKKILLIGLKDIKLAFRDKAGLIFMLLAPFLLSLGLGLVTGAFSNSGNSGIQQIPVVLVDQDGGQLGQALVDVFNSPDLADLVLPTVLDVPAAARQEVDRNHAAAAVIIPAGFTNSLIPAAGAATSSEVVSIELYANPTTPTDAGVIRTILEQYLGRVEAGLVGGQVAVTQLIASGRIQVEQAAAIGQSLGGSLADAPSAITLNSVTPSGEAVKFNVLAIMAPGMALMFLMYTTANGGRSLLIERNYGTLPRLLVSPTSSVQVLAGKTVGTYLTGVAQMLILIVATGLLFGLQWGDPLAMLALVLAAVVGAVGWGMLITAVAHTPGQVSAIGSAIMLTFGILGGTFLNTQNMPDWFRMLTKITPNAWGVDGFTTLALGGGLADILQPVLALLVMGLVLFSLAVLLINQRGLTQK